MNYIRVVLSSIIIVLTGCVQKNNAQPAAPGISELPQAIRDKYQLVWEDEFEGTDIDMNKWEYRGEGTVRSGTYAAIVSRDCVSINGDGTVSLKVLYDEATGQWHVGQLGTQPHFQTTYGYFQCRAKMNKKLGPHVAFWLQSPTISVGTDAAVHGTEIDIFEYHRKNPDRIWHTIHWGGYGSNHKQTGTYYDQTDINVGDDEFHTFGCEWTENGYTFFVDGKKTGEIREAISKRNQYMILSTELTGWGGTPDPGDFPDEVVFDYVRVYKRLD